MNHPFEIEVKFHISHVEDMRKRLLEIGATCLGRCFEHNLCFENEAKTLKKRDILLRLRKDQKARLTFKEPPKERDHEYKVFRELEIEVDDFDTCKAILESLGFQQERVYEKWRETFVLDTTNLLMDTTPFGVFLEIEGHRPDIRPVAERLGLQWGERILLNYLTMFELLRRGEGLPFADMTFENFQAIDCDVAPYLSSMYVA